MEKTRKKDKKKDSIPEKDSELSILSPLLGNNATLDVTATTTLDTTAATDVEHSADYKISSDSQHKKQKIHSKIQKFLNHPKTKHFLLVLQFFIFSVCLVTADIITDILTAADFFIRGDIYWATFTTIPVLSPFAARLVLNVINFYRRKEDLSQLFWHFPLFHPIRNIRVMFAMIFMDTNLKQNAKLIEILRKEVLGSSLLEVFLEAAPQFILQSYIILKTGNATTSQISSLPFSFISLACASSKLFYSQRLGQLHEQTPCLNMIILATLLNIFLIISSLFSYIILALHIQQYVIIAYITVTIIQLITLKLKFFGKKSLQNITDNLYGKQKEYGKKESQFIFFIAILTVWISPCTVWISNSYKKFNFILIASLVNAGAQCLSIVTTYFLSHFNTFLPFQIPSLIHCVKDYEDFNRSDYRFYFGDNSTHRLFHICDKFEDCLPILKICSEDENATDILSKIITPIWIALILISFCASVCLQKLDNYIKMYRWSRKICFDCSKIFLNMLKDYIFIPTLLLSESKELMLSLKVAQKKLNASDFQKLDDILKKEVKQIRRCSEEKDMLNQIRHAIQNLKPPEESVQTESIWEDPENPPMHKAIKTCNLKTLCFLNILGGHWNAVNGESEPKSCVFEIMTKIKNGNMVIDSNPIIKWWINRAIAKYGVAAHDAVRNGDIYLLEILMATNNDPNLTDKDDMTPLHIAAKTGNTIALRLMIEYDADVNARDFNGQTPLHIAVTHEATECTELLINSGSKVNTADLNDQTPLHIAAENQRMKNVELLIENGAKVDLADETHETALHIAVSQWQGGENVIRYLISKGANINAAGFNGKSPLHYASEKRNFSIAKLLIDSEADVKGKDQYQWTALHYAANRSGDDIELARYLILKGAEVNATNSNDKTPYNYAFERGNVKISNILIENGAVSNNQKPLNKYMTWPRLKV